jgi:putative transcriptional regulator
MNESEFAAFMGAIDDVVEHHEDRKRDLRTTVLSARPEPITADEVRQLRERLHASQAVFAHVLNVTPSTVQAWEAGNRHPDGGNLKLLRLSEAHPEIVFGEILAEGDSAKR